MRTIQTEKAAQFTRKALGKMLGAKLNPNIARETIAKRLKKIEREQRKLRDKGRRA